jgi:hypothetical protein
MERAFDVCPRKTTVFINSEIGGPIMERDKTVGLYCRQHSLDVERLADSPQHKRDFKGPCRDSQAGLGRVRDQAAGAVAA